MTDYSIRYFDYLDEYLKLLTYYSTEQNGILSIYYKFNYEESIMDAKTNDEYTRTGSYDLFGNLSGYKWDKIYFLPIHFSSSTPYMFEYNETGKKKDISIEISIPKSYGLIPNELDFIFFVSDYQMENLNTPIFKITQISLSHFGHYKFYKLSLNTHYATVQDLDNQINENYLFVEPLKGIYPFDVAEAILETYKSWDLLGRKSNYYIHNVSLYQI